MKERSGLVTMRGNPVILLGEEIKAGQPAPNFVAVENDLKPLEFASLRGKTCIIYSVPSLDTPVCDRSTRKFNEDAAGLGPDVAILVLSMDLPFAQSRWCGAAGVEQVKTLSDHRDASFGQAYGVLMKDLRLLARAVFVVDKSGIVQHVDLVGEIAEEPNYEAALAAARRVA